MSIDIRSTGNGSLGNLGNVTGYSVSIDATPISAVDGGGGTPSVTIRLEPTPTIPLTRLMHDEVQLSDDEDRGSVYGRVIDISDDESEAEITVESVLSRLVGTVEIAPYSGSLADYLTSIVQLADESVSVDIRGGVGAPDIVMPYVSGTAWDIIKTLGVAFRFQTSMFDRAVTFAPLRSASFSYRSLTSKSHRLANDRNARNTEIAYMNSQWEDSTLIYPRPKLRTEESQNIISGQSGSLLTVPLSCPGAFPASVVTPIAATPDTTPDAGVSYYYVLNGSGDYVDPSEWANAGGSVGITIDANGEGLTARVRIPEGLNDGPYAIAESVDNVGGTVNSLRVYGDGVVQEPRTVEFATGADDEITVDDIGYSISSPIHMSATEAYNASYGVAIELSSNIQTLDGKLSMPKLESLSDDWGAFIFSDFNVNSGSDTFSDLNTELGSTLFSELNEIFTEQAVALFASQMFAILAGGRLRYEFANYRITSVTITEESFSFSAVQDTVCVDMDEVYSGLTCEQIADAYDSEGMNCREITALPLYLPGVDPGDGLYPSITLYPSTTLYPSE